MKFMRLKYFFEWDKKVNKIDLTCSLVVRNDFEEGGNFFITDCLYNKLSTKFKRVYHLSKCTVRAAIYQGFN